MRDVQIPLTRRTILVGANTVGKTSVLEALDAILGVGRRGFGFSEGDVSSGVSLEEGIRVTVWFTLIEPTDNEIGIFGTHLDEADAVTTLILQASARTDPDDDVFRTRLRFLKSDLGDDGPVNQSQRQSLGFVLLPALRNARHEFRDRYGMWARFAAGLPVDQATADELDALGQSLGAAVLDKLLGETGRDHLRTAIAGTVGRVLHADPDATEIAFSMTPEDPAESLRQVDIRLGSQGQPARTIGDHGLGTQSVALFGLFDAYLAGISSQPILLGIEEPEAHLHPHAVRGLVRSVYESRTQTIVTTHSPAVTDAADPRSLVLLRRRADQTVCSIVGPGTFTEPEIRALRRHILEVGSDFLFARSVLLAEGPSERLAIPVFAASLGIDMDSLAVTIVPVGGKGFRSFAKLLGHDSLDIAHELIMDLDAAKSVLRQAMQLGLIPDEPITDITDFRTSAEAIGIRWWSLGTLEDCLIGNGAAPLYAQAFEEQEGTAFLRNFATGAGLSPGALDDPAFLLEATKRSKASKPHLAQRVAELFAETATPVPGEVAAVIHSIARAALREATLAVREPEEAAG